MTAAALARSAQKALRSLGPLWLLSMGAAAQPAQAPGAPAASQPAPDGTPEQRARSIADALPHVLRARATLREEIGRIGDARLREAVQAQLAAPGLPADAFASQHPAEAARRLRALGLLEGALPALTGAGAFEAAPGGPCPDGHHAYPGGLAVHTAANVLHAVALAQVYARVYGPALDLDVLRAAAAWHDQAKALTLRWRGAGLCGPEPVLAKTAAHHPIGVAAAIARKLPARFVVVLASAHLPPSGDNMAKLCGFLRAGSVLATGAPDAVPCPAAPTDAPIEAFVHHASDADYALTGAASVAAVGNAAGGFERFEKLRGASELSLWPASAAPSR